MFNYATNIRTVAWCRFLATAVCLTAVLREVPAAAQPVEAPDPEAAAEAPFENATLAYGHVLAKATGKPLAGILVKFSAPPGQPQYSVKTNDKGAFSIWCMASGTLVAMVEAQQGYASAYKAAVVANFHQKLNVGDIVLEKSVLLSGTITTADGGPAPGANVSIKEATSKPLEGGAGGAFTLGPVGPGHYYLVTSDSTGWQLVEPLQLDVANADVAPLPLRVIVKKITFLKATGRVVNAQGEKQAGVRIRYSTRQLKPVMMTSGRMAVTDAEGVFQFVLPEETTPSISGVEDETRTVQTAGTATLTDNVWNFTDTVVRARTGDLSGHVLDEEGKAVNGALVMALTDVTSRQEPMTTGEGGSFAIAHLPDGEITLVAADDSGFGRAVANTGAVAELRLTRPAPLTAAEREDLQARVLKRGIGELLPFWNALGSAKMRDFALRADGVVAADGTLDYDKARRFTSEYLDQLGSHDPAFAATEGVQLLAKCPRLQENLQMRFSLWRAVALKGDAAARATAKDQLLALVATQFAGQGDDTFQSGKRWFSCAGLLAKLGDPHAADCLQQGLAQLQRAAPEKWANLLQNWGEPIGIGGLPLLRTASAGLTTSDQFNLYWGAASSLGRAHPDQAVEFAKLLKALAQDDTGQPAVAPGVVAPATVTPGGAAPIVVPGQLDQKTLLATGLQRHWSEVADVDPITALLGSEGADIGNFVARKVLLSALDRDDKPLARQAWLRMLHSEHPPGDVYIYHRVEPIDPEMTENVFAGQRSRFVAPTLFTRSPEGIAFAFYDFPREPTADRLVLEAAAFASGAAASGDRSLPGGSRPGFMLPARAMPGAFSLNLGDIAVAMTAFDAHRALEILASVPVIPGRIDHYTARVFVALSVDETTRQKLMLFGY